VGFANANLFDEWQLWIFKVVLFILFVSAACRLLNAELHVGEFVAWILRKWRSK
jgi:hypothetical protein